MLHSLEVFFLRIYMTIFKFVVQYILPFNPPKLFDGPDSSVELARHVVSEGHKKIFIVTDAMLVKLGLLKDIEAALTEAGADYVVFDGVQPDPTIALIEEGYALLKSNNCDAIIAVGGGSSIDAAKVMGARAKNNKSVQKMGGLFRVFFGMLPLYAVPTTAGTGSEVTIAAVVSDPDLQRKFAIMDIKLMPTGAALDAKLMTGLPAPITAATGMDALTHAVEAYISRASFPATDDDAVEATKLIMQHLETAYDDGSNIEARQGMALASHKAGRAFTQAGVGYVHAIAHNFGAYYHVPHGLANAIVMPHVLDYSLPNCAGRLAELSRKAGVSQSGNDEEAAKAFIQRIRDLNAKFDIPSTLDKLDKNHIPAIAEAARAEARFTYAVPRYMDQPNAIEVISRMLPA